MKILVCGASGFLGKAISDRLAAGGHEVVRGTRGDFWQPRPVGFDAVVNAVGVIDSRDFDAIHYQGPKKLFEAAVKAGARRIIQVSALGAERGDTPFFASKRAADEALAQLPIEWIVLRPSLVYGPDGASARLFRWLASLPLTPVPSLPGAMFQPIYVDDVAEAVDRALHVPAGQIVDLVGTERAAFAGMLARYRHALGLGPLRAITVPAWLMDLLARLGNALPGSPLNRDSWKMLKAGSCSNAAATTRLLGRAPRPIDDFITADDAAQARSADRQRMLRAALAIVWLATAWISAFVYPEHDSLALLAPLGLKGAAAQTALYGAAALDFLFGALTLLRPSRALWKAQAAIIAGYSAVIAATLPEFLIHPFGPLLKNIPILAILYVLHRESWTTK